MSVSRKRLEREASYLAVPWVPENTDSELERMIMARKQGEDVFEAIRVYPRCWGMWEANIPTPCRGCHLKDKCLDHLATTLIPEKRAELVNPSLTDLADSLGVDESSVLFAMGHAEKLEGKEPVKVDREPVQMELIAGGKDAVEDPPIPELPPIDPKPEEVEVVEVDTKEPPVKKKKVAKKKATKKVAKKKVAKKITKESKNPPIAAPVKSAKVAAKTKKKGSIVRVAKAQAGKESGSVESLFTKRFQKEKKRKYMENLYPGLELSREFKGKNYKTMVMGEGYMYDGISYPTLYAVTKEITGTQPRDRQLTKEGQRPEGTRNMCNWSAVRFWKLNEL